ncbi:ATP-dependent nuclease [Leucobacter sp. HY1910]
MKISRVQISNYRSLRDVDITMDDYSALVGANGSGKSSVLYALNWFFNGGSLEPDDVHGYKEGETSDEDCFVEVTVTFRDLSAQDRVRLEQYGRGSTAVFRRRWQKGAGEKVVGNALQGPGFAAVRSMSRVGEFRPAYLALRSLHPDLPDLGSAPSKDQVFAALTEWEGLPGSSGLLESINDSDAKHMFGINGTNVINDCVRLVLIPAATDISSQVGDHSSKGSALNGLIGALTSEASVRATSEWISENETILGQLQVKVKDAIETSTGVQAGRINSRLASLIPNASLSLMPSIPDWTPKISTTVATDVTIDGATNDIGRQGHGVQRAVMISMFEALAPDDELARSQHGIREGEDDEAAALRLEEELARLPGLIICIEEPEIYQHPIRARAFARTLTELSGQGKTQVIVATHSPYFVRPEQFSSLRRFTLSSSISEVKSASTEGIAQSTGIQPEKIAKILDKRVPTEFSEGFFADSVVLVEGDTDRAVLEALASKLDLDLDSRGTSVIEVSAKESLRIPFELFAALGIPTHVMADADYLGAARKHPSNQARQDLARTSHQLATETIVGWAPSENGAVGAGTFQFGDQTTVTPFVTYWHDDLENELSEWPSFMAALRADGYQLRDKNLYAYRSAVDDADIDDMPEKLRATIEMIADFAAKQEVAKASQTPTLD